VGLKLNAKHQLLLYADGVNLLGDNMNSVKKTTETLTDASKEVGLEVNAEKTKYMYKYHARFMQYHIYYCCSLCAALQTAASSKIHALPYSLKLFPPCSHWRQQQHQARLMHYSINVVSSV
jgi:hypothetical protein